MTRKKPVVLCILDGWGLAENPEYCAITKAKTPNFDKIIVQYPNSTLEASGKNVGLPTGQMGNSEVGHTNIGAGRIVFQSLPKINNSVEKDDLKNQPTVVKTLRKLKESKGSLHLMGLLSDGGIHSHINHIVSLAKSFGEVGVQVNIHCFLDGRDTPPKSALKYVEQLETETKEYNNVKIATLGGRYFGMDRDKRWERVQKAYDVITLGEQVNSASDAVSAIKNSYMQEKTDEFVEPIAISGYKGMNDGDAFIFANFRADRAREITMALADPKFTSFERKKIVKFVSQVQMTEYSKEHSEYLDTIFPPENIKNSLGEVISNEGLKQLRIAETEKYAHVTFFFSGGREKEFKREKRILVDSPKCATYDLQPEMSAPKVTDKLVEAIKSDEFDFIVVNYANPDMVGHTGIMEAAVKACEEVDKDLGRLIDAVKEKDGIIFVTADHGNVEKMGETHSDQPHTAHTTSKVPFIIVGNDVSKYKLKNGNLSNIAPTILDIMKIKKPKEIDSKSLIK